MKGPRYKHVAVKLRGVRLDMAGVVQTVCDAMKAGSVPEPMIVEYRDQAMMFDREHAVSVSELWVMVS